MAQALNFYRLYLTGQEHPAHPTGMGYRDCIAWQDVGGDFILFYTSTCETVRLTPQQFRALAPQLAPGKTVEAAKVRIKRNAEAQERLHLPYERDMVEYLLRNIDALAAPPPPAVDTDPSTFRVRVRNRA